MIIYWIVNAFWFDNLPILFHYDLFSFFVISNIIRGKKNHSCNAFTLKFQGTVIIRSEIRFLQKNEYKKNISAWKWNSVQFYSFHERREKSVLRSRLGKSNVWKRLDLAMTLRNVNVVKSRVRDSKERRRRRRRLLETTIY